MITDQVVDVLAAEGYSRDSVRKAMDWLVEDEWRDEDEDWYEKDLRALRKHLGAPRADVPQEAVVEGPRRIAYDPHDPRYDTDLWAADLTRVLHRTTGGDVPLSPDQIRRAADYLLHRSSGLWDPEAHHPRIEGGSYVPDFTVDRWADAIHEALEAATDGIDVTRVELQVAANLLLHAQEEGWVSQAALLRSEHELKAAEAP
jgi:hypothetical protein